MRVAAPTSLTALSIGTFLLVIALGNGPARAENLQSGADLGVSRSQPAHISPSRRVAAPPIPGAWFEPQRHGAGIVYRFREPMAGLAPVIAPDQRLSMLCRDGLFQQAMPLRLRAVDGDNHVFGLAFGSGGRRSNLHDPGGHAARDQVYLFKSQGTGRCAVWAGSLQAARSAAGLTPEGRPEPAR